MKDTHHFLTVTVIRARDLDIPDNGKGNPFCVLEANGVRRCTRFRIGTKNPVWEERLQMVADDQPDRVNLIVKDHIDEKLHRVIGSAQFDLKEQFESAKKTISLPLLYENIAGETVKVGDIDIKLNHTPIDSKRRMHFGWDKILTLDINELKNIPLYAQMLEQNSQLFIRTSLGAQQFNTFVIDLDKDEFQNSAGFFFVDSNYMRDEDIILDLWLRKHNDDIHVGKGILKINDAINGGYKSQRNCIYLYESKEDLTYMREIGMIELTSKVHHRDIIENKICGLIFDEYDYNFDGRLNHEEVFDLMASIMPESNLGSLHKRVKELMAGKKFLVKEELITFLKSAETASNPFMNLLIMASLQGRSYPYKAALMRGVIYPNKKDVRKIKIKDRQTGLLHEESVPMYIDMISRALEEDKNDSKFTENCKMLVRRLSHRQEYCFSARQSKEEIVPFITQHKIEYNDAKIRPFKFKNFNHFYARELSLDNRPVEFLDDDRIIVSPADCRISVYNSVKDSENFWAKNGNIKLSSLFCDEDFEGKYSSGSLVICRFAPEDAHSWSSPVTGIQGKFMHVESDISYPLHPLFNGLKYAHCNERLLSELQTSEFGPVLLIALNGAMNGSIKQKTKLLQKLKKGLPHGHFTFGGSTLLLFLRKGRVGFDVDLLRNSSKGLETSIKAHRRIGVAIDHKYRR